MKTRFNVFQNTLMDIWRMMKEPYLLSYPQTPKTKNANYSELNKGPRYGTLLCTYQIA